MGKQKRDKKQAVNQFAIYEVAIKKNEQTDAFKQDIDPDVALANAHSHWTALFSNEKLALSSTTRLSDSDVEVTEYDNDILALHEGVYLLRVHNNKRHKMTLPDGVLPNGHQNYNEFIKYSKPFCYVVVDTRSSPSLIAIQKNSAFGDPNNVMKILAKGLSAMMQVTQPLKVEIFAKTRASKIWEFCRSRCQGGEDSISRISFDFPNMRDYADMEGAPALPRGLEEMAKVMELTNALKMHMNFDYDSADPQQLEEQTSNMAEVVRYCGRNSRYKLSVHFREYGEYRCDDQVRALFPMSKELLMDFISCFMNIPFDKKNLFAMIDWCDHTKKQIKDYENAIQIPAKRHRRSKKAI